jgi:hypothetical protein
LNVVDYRLYLAKEIHPYVEHVQCFVHPVVCLTSLVGMTIGVLENDWLYVLMVPSFPPTLLLSNEDISLL